MHGMELSMVARAPAGNSDGTGRRDARLKAVALTAVHPAPFTVVRSVKLLPANFHAQCPSSSALCVCPRVVAEVETLSVDCGFPGIGLARTSLARKFGSGIKVGSGWAGTCLTSPMSPSGRLRDILEKLRRLVTCNRRLFRHK